MKKITFIILVVGIAGLLTHFFSEKKKIIAMLDEVNMQTQNMYFIAPEKPEHDISKQFMLKPDMQNLESDKV